MLAAARPPDSEPNGAHAAGGDEDKGLRLARSPLHHVDVESVAQGRGTFARLDSAMTSDKQRKSDARALAAAEGISYTAALRRLTEAAPALTVASLEIVHPQGFGGHEFEYQSDKDLFGCVHCGGYEIVLRDKDSGEIRPCPKTAIGLTPPPDWPTRSSLPAMVSTFHDGTTRTVQVRDAHTQELIAETTAVYRPAEELIAEYETAGLIGGSPGSEWHTATLRTVGLGRPDLIAHQLGYDAGGVISRWIEWRDGSWRNTAKPLKRRHLVTLEPLRPGVTDLNALTIREYPGGRVVVDELIDPISPDDHTAMARLLDRHGYTTTQRHGWQRLPGGVRYAAALPGRLAERSWFTEAKVRIVKGYRAGAVAPNTERRYLVGEEVQLIQWGRAGKEVDRDSWWTSMDIDGAYILPAEHVQVVEVLEDIPPFWAQAVLPAQQVLDLIAPHHDGAEAAVAAWYASGLVVARSRNGLRIYTPAPEYRPVGELDRDYWDGAAGRTNQYTKPYEAVVDPQSSWLNKKLDHLPLDPIAAAAPAAELTKSEVADLFVTPCDGCICCSQGGCNLGSRSECAGGGCPCTSD